MARAAIIGGGSFGTAMACVARRAGLETTLWAREPEVVDAINGGQGNPLFLSGIELEPGIQASTSLEQSLSDADFILLAVPSQFLRGVAAQMRPILRPGIPVVSCSKGIERDTCALMPEVIAAALPEATVAVLAGPSFAKEVALGLPTGVTLASADRMTGRTTGTGTHHRTFPRLYVRRSDQCDHRRRVQERAGHCLRHRHCPQDGRERPRAADRSWAVRDGLHRPRQGRQSDQSAGSRRQRRRHLDLHGNAVAKYHIRDCSRRRPIAGGMLAERKVVTEGVHTAASITELGRRLGLAVPIASAVNRIVNEGASIDATFADLLARPAGPELVELA